MSNTSDFGHTFSNNIQISEGATIVEATNVQGKTCQLVDNTGTIDHQTLKNLLSELIDGNQFGINALSSQNGVINIDKPRLTHIQINKELYRLLLYRYQAIIESF